MPLVPCLISISLALQPLEDPKMDVSESEIELARQNEALNRHIAELHGAQAFRDYYTLHKPGARLPPVSPVLLKALKIHVCVLLTMISLLQFLLAVKSSTQRT